MRKIPAVALAAAIVVNSGASSDALTFLSDKLLDKNMVLEYYKKASERVYLGDVRVDQRLIENNMRKANRKPSWIVIHDTANPAPSATASAHINYYEKNTREASAHYTVDDTRIVQTVLDKDIAFHAGGTNAEGCGNSNSIGIEMCINEGGDFKKTMESTVALTQYLMDKYKIPKSHVVRHYDITGKECPGKFIKENPKLWTEFRNSLKEPVKQEEKKIPKVVETATDCLILKSNSENSEVEAKVKQGIRLDVLDYNDTWCKVSVKGIEGFIETKNLIIEEPIKMVDIKHTVAMYSNTDISKADVTMLSNGVTVSLLKENDKWCKVKHNDSVGYILTNRLM